jgi:hypothetical protein
VAARHGPEILLQIIQIVSVVSGLPFPTRSTHSPWLRRDAVGLAQRGHELDVAVFVGEAAEEGRRPVVDVEAAEEGVVGDEAAPALADEGGAGQRRGERR